MRILTTLIVVCLSAHVSPAQSQNYIDAAVPRSSAERPVSFVLSRIDEPIIDRFRQAWKQSAFGTRELEAVILLFRHANGIIKAISAGSSKESYRFSFTWSPAILAIVHTHPNICNPRPGPEDIELAGRFSVPVFTITRTGMYVYDPSTAKTSLIMDSLDWLESASWSKVRDRADGRPETRAGKRLR